MAFRAVMVTLLLVLATSCEPFSVIHVYSALTSTPAPGCVSSALTSSRLVSSVVSIQPSRDQVRRGERGFRFALVGEDGWNLSPRLLELSMGDSLTKLTVAFMWLGTLKRVPETVRQHVERTGVQLIGEIRSACAPSLQSAVTCEEGDNPAHMLRCSVAP